MKKLTKILAAIAIVVVALVVVLIVLAKVVITPERVKQTVLPLAESQLHRKVELGDINVSLFSGIELHDLKIYETDGREAFVSTELVRLKYQLLPLLAMKVVIDEVRVETPQIRVVRSADGRFSFDDMIAGKPADKAKPTAAERSAGDASATPISLLVSQVSVRDGKLLFIDHMVNPKAPHSTEVSALQVDAKGLTLTGSVPVTVTCRINDATLDVNGSVSLVGPSGDFTIKLDGVDALAFKPYYKEAVPGQLDSLKLNLNARVSGGLAEVAAAGSLKLSALDLTLAALPDAPLKNAAVGLDYDLTVGLQSGVLDLRSARVDFNGLVAELAGKVNNLFQQPALALQLTVPELELQKAMQSVPAGLVAGVQELAPSGKVKLDAQLSGTLADPLKLLRKASVSLDNVQVSASGQRPAVFGKLNLAGESLVSEGLEMRLGENRARLDLNASNLFGKPIVVKADVSSEKFLLDPLLGAGAAAGAAASKDSGAAAKSQKAAAGQGAAPGKKATPVAAAAELGPFDIPVRAKGTISIAETLYKGLAIRDFLATYQLQDNVLTISRMEGKVAGGSFANTARVDLGTRGLAYSADLGIKTIQADPLLTAFIPKAAGALLGAMNLDLNIKGRGTQWETLSKQLNGQGDMLVADGRVISPGLVKGFATFLQLPNLDEIRFSNFQGAVKIIDGKLNIDSRIVSDEIKLFPKGEIGLDGTLNLAMDTRLSPKVAGRLDSGGKVTRYLTDQEGWSQLPLLVSGNYAAPRFGLDPKGVQKQASEAIGKELGRQIEKLFGAPKPAPQDDGQAQPGETPAPAENPASKALQDSLKKLFGN